MSRRSHEQDCPVSIPRLTIIVLAAFFSLNCVAEESLIFTAPPRETVKKGIKTYAPIADYLSKVVGRKIEYRYPGNWLTYSADMRKGKYDVVFDGPHFVSWRVNHLHHVPLVKIPGGFIFRFVIRKDNNKINKVSDLVGKRVCGHAPPNQGTLRLYDEFKNPMRLPILVIEKGWRNIYKAMIKGRCEAAILPDKIYREVDPESDQSKILFTTIPVPGQAITACSKFKRADIVKMRKALISKEGMKATAALRKRFAAPKLTTATASEYAGVDRILKNTYGFGMVLN